MTASELTPEMLRGAILNRKPIVLHFNKYDPDNPVCVKNVQDWEGYLDSLAMGLVGKPFIFSELVKAGVLEVRGLVATS